MNGQHTSARRHRIGFTLVELLVTMAIMAILSAAMAYVMAGAQESAQIAKTKALIARLHALVMQKYESYLYRRLPVTIPTAPNGAPLSTRLVAQIRCDVIRQLMRMEMPERWTDIYDGPTTLTYGSLTINMTRPACSQAYLAYFNSILPSMPSDRTLDQGAECLYAFITLGTDEPDVLENFSESDIRPDPNNPACKVFADAWGNPIAFLRWAPGFISPLQPAPPLAVGFKDYRMPDQTDPLEVHGSPKIGSLVPANQNKGTDGPGRAHGNTFALYPLIYSAGPDGNYDIATDYQVKSASNTTPAEPSGPLKGLFSYAATGGTRAGSGPNDPFVSVSDTMDFVDGPIGWSAVYPGAQRGTRAIGISDNIHNHSIGAR
jgi:prepilin-type N-terminal cleavage/methylation domain-containing protein